MVITRIIKKENINAKIVSLYNNGMFLENLLNNTSLLIQLQNKKSRFVKPTFLMIRSLLFNGIYIYYFFISLINPSSTSYTTLANLSISSLI